ncbi:hypothetical protein KG088_17765 [Halomonas sp. TRM85114]|uniref:DUF7379 domain-containing protein n=1 Tax=Halomonas jincaotanensis TaxID=2810616 RepID=UPI001BD2A735|nr:hypothetical protein [Halomonas jincaotanensis]MBS9405455.1 hypothetical protein [Halomonas jincaotanensis]
MATVTRSSGIRVITTNTVRVVPEDDPGSGISALRRGRRATERPRGPIPLTSPTDEEDEATRIFASLTDELELTDIIPLEPTVTPTSAEGTRSRSAESIPATQGVDVDVPLEAGEWAVLLIEQDGIFAWDFGAVEEQPPEPTSQDASVRRGAPRATGRVAHFHVDLHVRGTAARRRTRFGFISNLLLRPAKAAVFKFTANVVVGQVVKRLERDVERGLVEITGPEPVTWRRCDSILELNLPIHRAPRILLFVHGTFSSTLGGFGVVGLTQAGKAFLDDARDAYDAIVGFDHATLSEDPVENAEHLLELLQADEGPHPPNIDVIAHSRGVLVIRSLVEHLQPAGLHMGRPHPQTGPRRRTKQRHRACQGIELAYYDRSLHQPCSRDVTCTLVPGPKR